VQVIGDLRHNSYPGGDPVELFVDQLLHAGALLAPVQVAAPQRGVQRVQAPAASSQQVSALPDACEVSEAPCP
jgi:hypothetical protein